MQTQPMKLIPRRNLLKAAIVPVAIPIAAKHKYRGYFSMEWDTEADPYEGTARLIATTLKNMPKKD